jgi:chemotaxis protein methyltransferase CheR
MTPPTTASDAPELTTDDLAFVEQLVLSKIAVQLNGKAYLIESRLAPVARLHNLASLSELVHRLKMRVDRQLEADVIDAMTTNETSFFRDRHPFDVMGQKVIPRLLEAQGSSPGLTIWTAASSSGQEPLSVAMLLHERFPQLVAARRAKIVATDVSTAMVDRTQRAIYSRFEINRGLPASYATRFFEQQGRDWKAKKDLTDLIDAKQLNLIEPIKGVPKADIVLIRNVLIYFSAQVKLDILRRITTDVLKPGGFLFLGASETPNGLENLLTTVTVDGTRVFVKNGG